MVVPTHLMSAVLQGRQVHAEAQGAAGGGVALAGLPLAQAIDEQVRGRLPGRRLAHQHTVHVHQHLHRHALGEVGFSEPTERPVSRPA